MIQIAVIAFDMDDFMEFVSENLIEDVEFMGFTSHSDSKCGPHKMIITETVKSKNNPMYKGILHNLQIRLTTKTRMGYER